MPITEFAALRAYARMMNALGSTPLEPLLAEGFVYEPKAVLEPLDAHFKCDINRL